MRYKSFLQGLQAVNVGDSGFLVLRNGHLVFKSPVQQHTFNLPYQLESHGGDPVSSAEVCLLVNLLLYYSLLKVLPFAI